MRWNVVSYDEPLAYQMTIRLVNYVQPKWINLPSQLTLVKFTFWFLNLNFNHTLTSVIKPWFMPKIVRESNTCTREVNLRGIRHIK